MKKFDKILLIDGENLRHFVEQVIFDNGYDKHKFSILNVDFGKMLKDALNGLNVEKKIYYSAKLQLFKDTPQISKILIKKQRLLKTKLEKQGYEFLIAGNVRPQLVEQNGKTKTVFREKGVDVRIAVDLVKIAVDKTYKSVVLCSSDSDLQPAIKEARNRGLEVIYFGFEFKPNKGLMYTTNKTILLRSSEIIGAFDDGKH